MNEESASLIEKQLKQLNGNYNAQVILADMIRNGFSIEDFLVSNKGIFQRSFRKDILKVDKRETGKDKYRIELDLSRNGIYDLLPQGVLHTQGITNHKKVNVSDMTEVYKRRKKEEAEARDFFFPFEYELFLHLLTLEEEERRLLYGYRHIFHEFLIHFWDLDSVLSKKYLSGLLKVLPFMSKISGDFDLICTCLTEILDVEVRYILKFEEEYLSDISKLGSARLSQNLILGNNTASLPFVEFSFSGIKDENIVDFLEYGKTREFIHKFFDYAVPVEFNSRIRIFAEDKPAKKQEKHFGRLGVTLKI